MTIKLTAGHDDTTPAFEWQGLQLFAEEGADGSDAGAGSNEPPQDQPGQGTDPNSAGDGDGAGGADGAGGNGEDGKQDPAAQVPEKYELDLPEGFTVDDALMNDFTGVAKELGLNNEQANKLVGMHTKVMQDAFQALNDARNQEVVSWGENAKKELGAGYDATIRDVALGLQAVEKDIPSLREAMDKTGFGNTIEGIKLMAAIGKICGEDQGGKDHGGKDAAGSESIGSIFFPNSQK